MGKAENKGKLAEKSVKRHRNSSDENSPTLTQEKKAAKMSVEKNEFETLLTTVNSMAAKLEKLDMLDSMNAKIEEIASANREVKEEVKDIKNRVETLERDIEGIAVRGSDNVLCEMQRKIAILEQAQQNSSVIIRNLPNTVKSSLNVRNELLENLFKALDYNQTPCYTEETSLSRDKKSATLSVTFISPLVKNDVIKTYRAVKKDATKSQKLLLENLMPLPIDDPLNGQLITIMNKLTPHYTQLITHARKYVGTHFEFVYDSPEGNIVVRYLGKFKKVNTEEEIQILIQEVTDKGEVKTKKKKSQLPESNIRTRSMSQTDKI